MALATESVRVIALPARLAAARRRFAVQSVIAGSARLLLCVALGALAWTIANFLRGAPAVSSALVAGSIGIWVAGTLGLAAFSFRPIAATARALDELAGTQDRFQTALVFAGRPERAEFETLAIDECERYATRFEVERWIPLRFPRLAAWALAPIASIALLHWHASLEAMANRPDPATQAMVGGQAKTLELIAAELAKVAETRQDDELAKLAKEMQERAARLRDRAATDRDADKLALREISVLEAMLRQMQQSANAPKASPEELAALAEALARAPGGKDAAEALKRGDTAEAGRQLEALLQKLKQRGDAAKQMEELARSMQEETARLSADQKSEVARQMEQAAQAAQAGRSDQVQQLLQRLAELLKQTGRPGAAGKSGAPKPGEGKSGQSSQVPLNAKTLQELINALEKLKQSGGGDNDAVGEASRALMRIPLPEPGGKPSPSGGPPEADKSDLAGGQPGTEKDRGSSDKLFSDKTPDAKSAEGPGRRLEGMLGDGASLQEFMPSAGAGGKSSRAYQELYGVMAPAAQDAVEQENIPLGARFYIRKYFESIRPPE